MATKSLCRLNGKLFYLPKGYAPALDDKGGIIDGKAQRLDGNQIRNLVVVDYTVFIDERMSLVPRKGLKAVSTLCDCP